MNQELIKNNIVFRLISKEEFAHIEKQAEQEPRSRFPYQKWNDLYLIYKSMIPNPLNGYVVTLLITDIIMKELGLSNTELFEFAQKNTPKRTGVVLCGLDEISKDINVPAVIPTDTDVWHFPMEKQSPILLSNHNGLNASALILCDSVMDKIIKHYNTSVLYILPSSVHETIIYPDSANILISKFKNKIHDANRNPSLVPSGDRLSDHIYKYTCATKTFEML
ncbi:Uncharacterised protein [Anaerostipes hadrus]|uniref:Uncharacterized protein n=2 Tax=Anaerostipes hadrus TaxID=649756 RepID=A0A174PH61_ANAHA|nr:Uncharacterised protein [Anaerostipes hadrus]